VLEERIQGSAVLHSEIWKKKNESKKLKKPKLSNTLDGVLPATVGTCADPSLYSVEILSLLVGNAGSADGLTPLNTI
jgi:hypothetical protein